VRTPANNHQPDQLFGKTAAACLRRLSFSCKSVQIQLIFLFFFRLFFFLLIFVIIIDFFGFAAYTQPVSRTVSIATDRRI